MIETPGRFFIREVRVYQPQPLPIPDDWPRSLGPNRYIVYADSRAVERIMSHAAQNTRYECFGLLLGNAYLDEEMEQYWIYLQDAVAASDTQSDFTSVEVSREEFRRINEEVDRIQERSNGRIRKIGWYHSHPNFGIFMSHTDRTNQRRYYNQDWQLALVVDPVRGTMGFFHGASSNRCPHRIVETRVPLELLSAPRPAAPPTRTAGPRPSWSRPPGARPASTPSHRPPKKGLWDRFADWLIRLLSSTRSQ